MLGRQLSGEEWPYYLWVMVKILNSTGSDTTSVGSRRASHRHQVGALWPSLTAQRGTLVTIPAGISVFVPHVAFSHITPGEVGEGEVGMPSYSLIRVEV